MYWLLVRSDGDGHDAEAASPFFNCIWGVKFGGGKGGTELVWWTVSVPMVDCVEHGAPVYFRRDLV
jgi:hypothetical protein